MLTMFSPQTNYLLHQLTILPSLFHTLFLLLRGIFVNPIILTKRRIDLTSITYKSTWFWFIEFSKQFHCSFADLAISIQVGSLINLFNLIVYIVSKFSIYSQSIYFALVLSFVVVLKKKRWKTNIYVLFSLFKWLARNHIKWFIFYSLILYCYEWWIAYNININNYLASFISILNIILVFLYTANINIQNI